MIAPQQSGVFQPDNWHFPGIALKGDDAMALATILHGYEQTLREKPEPVSNADKIVHVGLLSSVERYRNLLNSCRQTSEP